LAARLDYVERQLAASGPYLLGERYSIADAYLYTILSWSAHTQVDLSAFQRVRRLIERVGERSAVRQALREEAGRPAA
jgi:glutathione S-transferase